VADLGGNPQWFAFVDLVPCALFQHDVLYVFVDDVTGEVKTFEALDWPLIDGVEMADFTGPGEKLIHVFPIVPGSARHPAESSPVLGVPSGDYGDAPDGVPAYPGIAGRFPTLYQTMNSSGQRPGGFTTGTEDLVLGKTISRELGVRDPDDSDGAPNLVDGDHDERMFLVWNPNPAPARAYVIFDATLKEDREEDAHYVNVLLDFNQDGQWGGNPGGREWAVQNQQVDLVPNQTTTQISDSFAWGSETSAPTLVWMRIGLGESRIDGEVFGADGWDGSGSLGVGEIEDAKVVLRNCPDAGCEPPGNPGDPEFEDPPPFTPCPGPKFGWDGNPIRYFALVVEGVDNPTQSAVEEAGKAMADFLTVQGYTTSRLQGKKRNQRDLNGDEVTTADRIVDWLAGVRTQVVCQDRVLVYFVAHGRKETPGGLMHIGTTAGGKPENFSGAQLEAALSMIPACKDEDCDTPGKSCQVTVLIESCYSGQFVDAVAGEGRDVISASDSDEPSYFGNDGSGGEFSDRYRECFEGGGSGLFDLNGDGFEEPGEMFGCFGSLAPKGGQSQTPQLKSGVCDCVCPPFVWDCLLDPRGLVAFFPGIWGGGDERAETFPEAGDGLEVGGGEAVYDRLKLPFEPVEWRWDFAILPNRDPEIPLEEPFPVSVQIQGLELAPVPGFQVPLFAPGDPELVLELSLPIQMEINLPANQVQIRDSAGQLIVEGPWSQYPQFLEQSPFFPIDAVRSIDLPPQTMDLSGGIAALGSEGEAEFLLLSWNPQPGACYLVQFKEDLRDEDWIDLVGPLKNTVYSHDLRNDFRGFLQVQPVFPDEGGGGAGPVRP
ncbi:MAG: hypothetical protein AAF514_04650, partial [Verrucomicrobiota bacterium]